MFNYEKKSRNRCTTVWMGNLIHKVKINNNVKEQPRKSLDDTMKNVKSK